MLVAQSSPTYVQEHTHLPSALHLPVIASQFSIEHAPLIASATGSISLDFNSQKMNCGVAVECIIIMIVISFSELLCESGNVHKGWVPNRVQARNITEFLENINKSIWQPRVNIVITKLYCIYIKVVQSLHCRMEMRLRIDVVHQSVLLSILPVRNYVRLFGKEQKQFRFRFFDQIY